ncbi:putative lipoprotein Rz1 precursor [Escherichia coli O103:H2 str. 12009]|nr:putative lipoprotein Rz1 precursor [Escherichia coli O103:H2 str. 12009]
MRFCSVKRTVISLFLLILLSGCSTTRTVYAPAHCTPIPGTLTQPVIVPLPPER